MSRMANKPLRAKEETVTLSRAQFDRLVARAEDAADLVALRAHDAEVAERGLDAVLAEALPVQAVLRIGEGTHPLRVWRNHRGMTLDALAVASGVNRSYISEIERGRKPGSYVAMGRLAKALGIRLEVLARDA